LHSSHDQHRVPLPAGELVEAARDIVGPWWLVGGEQEPPERVEPVAAGVVEEREGFSECPDRPDAVPVAFIAC
jgi:hypothetical protein